jgi:hypothetical protein
VKNAFSKIILNLKVSTFKRIAFFTLHGLLD